MVNGKLSLVLTRKPPEIVGHFPVLHSYTGVVFRTSPSVYRIQVFNLDGTPAMESEAQPLPFVAFRTTFSEVGVAWAPCWTEATKFEENNMRRVFYSFDAFNKVALVDKAKSEIIAEIGVQLEVDIHPSYVRLHFFL